MLYENTRLCYVIPSTSRFRYMALFFLVTVISSCVIENQILRGKISKPLTWKSKGGLTWNYLYDTIFMTLIVSGLEGEETLKYRHVCRPP